MKWNTHPSPDLIDWMLRPSNMLNPLHLVSISINASAASQLPRSIIQACEPSSPREQLSGIRGAYQYTENRYVFSLVGSNASLHSGDFAGLTNAERTHHHYPDR